MGNINEVYASKSNYLKAADLNGRTIKVTIEDIQLETVGDDKKLVLYFKGGKKGLVLNKTNANQIAMVLGMDWDHWIGGEITVFPMKVDFKGDLVDSIRVNPMPRPAGRRQGPSPQSFPDQGSYGKVTTGRPKADADDPRTMVEDENDEPIPF